ncbi:MAG TPA: site-specific integrase [Pyrinomonadaceae bacterium]|jgi:integrase
MARERTGFVVQRKNKKTDEIEFFARIQYVDDNTGKRRELMRKAKDEEDAQKIIKKLVKKLDGAGQSTIEGDRMKFLQLAAEYKKRRLIPAQYHGERKVAGLRSWKTQQGFLETLTRHFGGKRISTIRHDDIEQFKLKRIAQPVVREKKVKRDGKVEIIKTEKPRTLAGVNRELELMRAVMRFAFRQGWIARSPFETGAPLISKADETSRERVLSHDEERRLLEACGERTYAYTWRGRQLTARDKGKQRLYLRALIIAALDTAMRRGELIKLRWSDVNMDAQEIVIRAMNTKTARGRVVAMTPRLHAELEKLRASAPPDNDTLVFGIRDTVKRSFTAACKAAGIDGFRFHDCRHTAITRMIAAGVQPMEVMKVSGHTQHTTFARYVNPTSQTVRRAADALAAFNAEAGAQQAPELVN